MQVAIVGHGPSMLRAMLGQDIDEHDIVVRLKRSWDLCRYHPDRYGNKVDYAMGSIKVAVSLINGWRKFGCSKFWVFEDTRTVDQPYPEDAECDRELCRKWQAIYRDTRTVLHLDKRQVHYEGLSDDLGHLHPSAGTHAIIYALDRLKPDSLRLYGFDSLQSGDFTWSVTRGENHKTYPDHNWSAERDLLMKITDHYGYTREPVLSLASVMKFNHAA